MNLGKSLRDWAYAMQVLVMKNKVVKKEVGLN